MTSTGDSVLQRLLRGSSKIALFVGAIVFLFGGKFLYEIRHASFFTAEALGIFCGVLLMLVGAV